MTVCHDYHAWLPSQTQLYFLENDTASTLRACLEISLVADGLSQCSVGRVLRDYAVASMSLVQTMVDILTRRGCQFKPQTQNEFSGIEQVRDYWSAD